MIWQIVIYREFGLLRIKWKNKTFFYFMGNSNSSETDEVENLEVEKRKKSIKKKRAKRAKSLKRKNKITENEYDNIDQGTYPEFF